MKTLYYGETGFGACIRAYSDEQDAWKELEREVGTQMGVQKLREATKADVSYVRSMGGYIPSDGYLAEDVQ